jgi:hypothetical protein
VLFAGYSMLFENVTLPGGKELSAARPVPRADETDAGSPRS